VSITAKEIAEMLNVSPSAVSLALNGKPGVSESTRELILKTAAKYNYTVRNNQNSAPPRNIRYVIYLSEGHVVNEISFHSIVLQGIEATAKKLGYNVLVSYYYSDQSETEQLSAIFQNTEGIILLGTEFDETSGWLNHPIVSQHSKIPIVMVDNESFHAEIDCIYTDNLRGAYKAVDYLISQGHTNIGYFSSVQRIPNFDERSEGVRRALADHPEATAQVIPVDFSTEKAYRDICSWLKDQQELPTAFFADSDVIAFGAIRAFNRMGYNVPEDVSIIGFDDMPACEMVSPPLTSIRVMKVLMGSKAMEILHQRITEQNASPAAEQSGMLRIAISTDIKVRRSVTTPRSPVVIPKPSADVIATT
jgi:DNA-binding LacI/PurR family transcriptional regulator